MSILTLTLTPSFHTSNNTRSHRKKTPLPLHVSLYRIEAERVNLVLRTNNKLASLALDAAARQKRIFAARQDLIVAARQDVIVAQPQATTTNWHCCLNTICFCLLLVVFNLLIMQWLYYKSLNLNLKQLSIM